MFHLTHNIWQQWGCAWHKSLQSTLKLAFIPPSIIQTTHQAVFTELLKFPFSMRKYDQNMTRLHRTINTIPSFILFSLSTCSIWGQSVFADAAHKFQRQAWHVLKKMSHLKGTGLGLAKSWNQEGFDTFHNKLLIDDSESDRRLVLSENRSFQQKHVKWNCKTQNMH